MQEQCEWCSRTFERYIFGSWFCSEKCQREKERYEREQEERSRPTSLADVGYDLPDNDLDDQDENAGAAYFEGKKFLQAELYDEAISTLSNCRAPSWAIDTIPDLLMRAYAGRAGTRLDKRDYKRAIADYSMAISITDDKSKADYIYQNRGDLYARIGDHRSAIADYTSAVQIHRNYLYCYGARARSHAALGQTQEAMADYTYVITNLSPNAPQENIAREYVGRGHIYADLGLHDLAIADLSRAISLRPTSDACSMRGTVYIQTGNYDGAIADYTKAIDLDPSQAANLFLKCGDVHAKVYRFADAIINYSKSSALNPGLIQALVNRGAAFEKQGMKENAIADYQSAVMMKANKSSDQRLQIEVVDKLAKLQAL